MVELHIRLRIVNVDGAGFNGHQVGTEDHLVEAIVIHMLQARLLLGAINIDSFIFFIGDFFCFFLVTWMTEDPNWWWYIYLSSSGGTILVLAEEFLLVETLVTVVTVLMLNNKYFTVLTLLSSGDLIILH